MLEFFLEGVPDVIERHLDSKKVQVKNLIVCMCIVEYSYMYIFPVILQCHVKCNYVHIL